MPTEIKQLTIRDKNFDRTLSNLLDRQTESSVEVDETVRGIIDQVRLGGDQALLEFTRQFDQYSALMGEDLEIPKSRWAVARQSIDPDLETALLEAADRIREFHEAQKESSWQRERSDGSRYGQQVNPLDRVGVYVPGGKASYPSSVLMNVIPAKVAGVEEVVMVVPTPNGRINETVLASADIVGVDRVFRIGGAQAVAALTHGTETVPKVDKIVGPGNQYVATAKKQVFGLVGIDMIAGPSEVLVICDAGADPDWVAMDLFAQAEHDEQAQSIAICVGREIRVQVSQAINRLLPTMERRSIIEQALSDYGALIEVDSINEAISVANKIAPEHLELMIKAPRDWIPKIRHAGAIFCGYYSAESLGDYCAGPNHVLPTSGTARFSSPLGVYDFQKRSSVVDCSRAGAATLSGIASLIARAEGLTAHARSAEFRGYRQKVNPDD